MVGMALAAASPTWPARMPRMLNAGRMRLAGRSSLPSVRPMPNSFFKVVADRRQIFQRRLFLGRDGAHAVAEAGNQDAAVVIAHLREQRRGHRRGIRHPVAVVAVVQRAQRPVDRGLDLHDAARAEIHQRTARLMHRPIADENEIGAQELLILMQRVTQVRRSRLLPRLPRAL